MKGETDEKSNFIIYWACSYVLCSVLPLNAAAFTSFYVSPNGSDNADGSIAHPFSTIKRAQEAAREIIL